MLGGGQLGRMTALAAAQLGYRVHLFSPRADCPASQVCDIRTVADYYDAEAIARFAQAVDVVTLEFENVPAIATQLASQYAPMRPSADVLQTTQNRLREKRFLEAAGIACTPFASVSTPAELAAAVDRVGTPAVLKTCDSGYDGKGQAVVRSADQADAAWNRLDQLPAIYEGWVEYQRELSLLVARSPSGEIAFHGPIANDHVDHILDVAMFPLAELEPLWDEVRDVGRTIVERLELVGICCVEFFLTGNGRLLVNEIAPRPHNSGHLTIEACRTSQFEQQVRAVCGLPLGSTELVSPAAMANLLGDLWQTDEPNWQAALTEGDVRLHLYGKTEARPGRKMGHLTVLADSAPKAARIARQARERLDPSEVAASSQRSTEPKLTREN